MCDRNISSVQELGHVHLVTLKWMHLLEHDLVDAFSDGKILLLGDINSLTAQLKDFLVPDKNDKLLSIGQFQNVSVTLPE